MLPRLMFSSLRLDARGSATNMQGQDVVPWEWLVWTLILTLGLVTVH